MVFRPVVLFDFDGTLADSIHLIVESFHHTFAEAGLPAFPDAEVRSWIGRPLIAVFEEYFPTRGEELTDAYRTWNLAQHDALIRRIDGMPELLDALKAAGTALGVVSSKKTDTVRQGLRAVGLDDAIDVLAGMEETARHKPDPEPLLFAAAALGVEPGDCVYVGDAGVDIRAARAAGMAAIAVTWGAGARNELESLRPDAVVDSVAELRELLLAPEGHSTIAWAPAPQP